MQQHNDTNSDEYWEEILESIDMDFLPIEYMDLVIVKFDDGKVWEIDVKKSNNETENIEDALEQFFDEYHDSIKTIDFRLNTKKLQKDIGRRTKRFLKLNK